MGSGLVRTKRRERPVPPREAARPPVGMHIRRVRARPISLSMCMVCKDKPKRGINGPFCNVTIIIRHTRKTHENERNTLSNKATKTSLLFSDTRRWSLLVKWNCLQCMQSLTTSMSHDKLISSHTKKRTRRDPHPRFRAMQDLGFPSYPARARSQHTQTSHSTRTQPSCEMSRPPTYSPCNP